MPVVRVATMMTSGGGTGGPVNDRRKEMGMIGGHDEKNVTRIKVKPNQIEIDTMVRRDHGEIEMTETDVHHPRGSLILTLIDTVLTGQGETTIDRATHTKIVCIYTR